MTEGLLLAWVIVFALVVAAVLLGAAAATEAQRRAMAEQAYDDLIVAMRRKQTGFDRARARNHYGIGCTDGDCECRSPQGLNVAQKLGH